MDIFGFKKRKELKKHKEMLIEINSYNNKYLNLLYNDLNNTRNRTDYENEVLCEVNKVIRTRRNIKSLNDLRYNKVKREQAINNIVTNKDKQCDRKEGKLMKAYNVYFSAPGFEGNDNFICEDKGNLRSMLSKKYDCKESDFRINNIGTVNFEEVNIKDLDAQSFLNLISLAKEVN